ncbi:MAG: hypothetical protein GX335_03005 [Firmicutes bacterium]|nr:hypothetical protein [Bacillota bacterium]
MKDLSIKQAWQTHLESAIGLSWNGTTFSGFNANVDIVVSLTPQVVRNLISSNPSLNPAKIQKRLTDPLKSVRSPEDFIALLLEGLRGGKSLFVICETPPLMNWLKKMFPETEHKLGGQAGIISNQMSFLGARSLLYSPILSPQQAAVMNPGILYPSVQENRLHLQPLHSCVKADDPTHSPWVFEYRKNECYDLGFMKIITPRANRIILASKIPNLGLNFAPKLKPHLTELGVECQVGFVAGYHLGGPEPENPYARRKYFQESLNALRLFRSKNPALKIHLEYVPAKEREMELEMLSTITQQIDSFGINEIEIAKVLDSFGFQKLAQEIRENERAYALYEGAYALKEKLGVERIHVHNLGYYVLVLSKPYPSPLEKVRQACLFGSAVNARKALHGGFVTLEELPEAAIVPLSSLGFQQLQVFAKELQEKRAHTLDLSQFMNTGIAELDDHYVILVPAQVVADPVITVGMGDTISSASYATEIIGIKGEV